VGIDEGGERLPELQRLDGWVQNDGMLESARSSSVFVLSSVDGWRGKGGGRLQCGDSLRGAVIERALGLGAINVGKMGNG
jgi:hypothetical protein